MSMPKQTRITAPVVAVSDRQFEGAAAELAARIRGRVRAHELLARHTTWRIGGPADLFVQPLDLDDLLETIAFGREKGLPTKVLGNGSNILVGDGGIRGLAIRLAPNFAETEWREDGVVVGAGARLARVIKEAAERGLSGLESTVGIPGTMGGALATNAGTDTGSISDLVAEATVLDESDVVHQWGPTQFAYQYRHSNLYTAKAVVLSARLELKPAPREEIRAKMERLRGKRAGRQPLRAWSAGSVFKNLRAVAAGKALDRAGAKGLRVGDAQVSSKHANFLINRGRATAATMRELIARAHDLVQRRYDIDLDLEIEIVSE